MNIKDEIRRINEQARSICFTTRELQKELDTLPKPSVVRKCDCGEILSNYCPKCKKDWES